MANRMMIAGVAAFDLERPTWAQEEYDVGVWAAGYEARSGWLVQSAYAPSVGRWFRVEFEEHRTRLSAPRMLKLGIGDILGGQPGKGSWDGYWSTVWNEWIAAERNRCGRPISIFVDYSAMPRTVFGPLLVQCITESRSKVRSLTMAYVPGKHAENIVGSQSLGSLRALVGVEGQSAADMVPSFILGLGYDGILAEAVVDLFQVSSYCCVYGNPGVTPDAVQRAQRANARLLANAERVECAPASSCVDSCFAFQRLARWYEGRDVVITAMGPKPHVVGAMLAALADSSVAFRFAKKTRSDPVQVHAAPRAVPFACRFEP